MKEKLSIEVISAETNAELLTKIPHESMEDMAVVYRFVLESNDTGRAFSIYQVLPKIIELWGLNVRTDAEAKKNFAQQTAR